MGRNLSFCDLLASSDIAPVNSNSQRFGRTPSCAYVTWQTPRIIFILQIPGEEGKQCETKEGRLSSTEGSPEAVWSCAASQKLQEAQCLRGNPQYLPNSDQSHSLCGNLWVLMRAVHHEIIKSPLQCFLI